MNHKGCRYILVLFHSQLNLTHDYGLNKPFSSISAQHLRNRTHEQIADIQIAEAMNNISKGSTWGTF